MVERVLAGSWRRPAASALLGAARGPGSRCGDRSTVDGEGCVNGEDCCGPSTVGERGTAPTRSVALSPDAGEGAPVAPSSSGAGMMAASW